ncbi:MAG: hypothetical protein WGN25_03545 [Candidatus Electrothrix sp. GW3-4]|uniref:hypothetical protein n=1 Tax=Candidatus Electrothrix sp. GW3-4 TaxID=3126740 RepID=UPI0030D58035
MQTSTVLLSDSAASAAPERRPDEQTSAEKRSAVQEDELAETILLRADKEK